MHGSGQDYGLSNAIDTDPPLICFSHLRWDLVVQRPQHIMTRLSERFDIVYWEEPRVDADCLAPTLERTRPHEGVTRLIPVIPQSLDAQQTTEALAAFLQSRTQGGPAA